MDNKARVTHCWDIFEKQYYNLLFSDGISHSETTVHFFREKGSQFIQEIRGRDILRHTKQEFKAKLSATGILLEELLFSSESKVRELGKFLIE